MFVPMEFAGLTHDQTGSPIALLRETTGPRELRIAVSANDAARIAIFSFPGINDAANDLLQDLIIAMDAEVTHVRIVPEAERIVRCELFIQQDEKIVQLEPRPGEAIVLALLNDSPISVDTALFSQGSEPLTLREKIRLKDVTDFGTTRLY